METARDIQAATSYALALPDARQSGAAVIGVSGGGWGTMAYSSMPHPGVDAFVVMAGGRGTHIVRGTQLNIAPDAVVETAGRFGATSRTPMLWVYAANDSHFGPRFASAMRDAFVAAGGKVSFVETAPFGDEGHFLFSRKGVKIWGPLFDSYFKARFPNFQESPVARVSNDGKATTQAQEPELIGKELE